MVPKIGAQYLVKKFTDYVTAPAEEPEPRPEPGEPRAATPEYRAPAAALDGQLITDDDGQTLGVAHHVRGIAVYIVSNGFGDRLEELRQALADPDSRIMFHTENDRLAGLIYVPDPAKAPARTGGMRADEV